MKITDEMRKAVWREAARLGGLKAAANMTPEQRSERGRKAGLAGGSASAIAKWKRLGIDADSFTPEQMAVNRDRAAYRKARRVGLASAAAKRAKELEADENQ